MLPMDRLGQCRLQILNCAPGECVTVNITPGSNSGSGSSVAFAISKLNGKGWGARFTSTITGLPFLITNFKVIDSGGLALIATEHEYSRGDPVVIGELDLCLYLWASKQIASVDVSYSSATLGTQAAVGFALGDLDDLQTVPASKTLNFPWIDLVDE